MKRYDSDLVVIEKYNEFVNYIYPYLQQIPRKHGIVKEETIKLVFKQVDLFYKAAKSNHISKLYEADASLALLRYHLRFLADEKRKLISPRRHQVASILLAEVGKIVGTMIKNKGQVRQP
jgi:hypothetical protein